MKLLPTHLNTCDTRHDHSVPDVSNSVCFLMLWDLRKYGRLYSIQNAYIIKKANEITKDNFLKNIRIYQYNFRNIVSILIRETDIYLSTRRPLIGKHRDFNTFLGTLFSKGENLLHCRDHYYHMRIVLGFICTYNFMRVIPEKFVITNFISGCYI